MREIKFRYFWRHHNGHIICNAYSMFEIECGEPVDDMSYKPLVEGYELIDRALYTGFKDRNGESVYEGDLVAAWEMEIYAIVWDGQSGAFLAVAPNDSLTMEDIFPAGATDFAVVGNIHEDSGGVTSP